jgi:hypothetical protein
LASTAVSPAAQESSETPGQTIAEAARGDHQAQRRLHGAPVAQRVSSNPQVGRNINTKA